jgi:hypothetical protein
VIFRRRGQFAELVERQLALVEADDAHLLAGLESTRHAYTGADRDEAEEAFGDYQLALEALKDRLVEVRDAYAATLDDPEPYERAFERAAAKRWPDIEAV